MCDVVITTRRSQWSVCDAGWTAGRTTRDTRPRVRRRSFCDDCTGRLSVLHTTNRRTYISQPPKTFHF